MISKSWPSVELAQFVPFKFGKKKHPPPTTNDVFVGEFHGALPWSLESCTWSSTQSCKKSTCTRQQRTRVSSSGGVVAGKQPAREVREISGLRWCGSGKWIKFVSYGSKWGGKKGVNNRYSWKNARRCSGKWRERCGKDRDLQDMRNSYGFVRKTLRSQRAGFTASDGFQWFSACYFDSSNLWQWPSWDSCFHANSRMIPHLRIQAKQREEEDVRMERGYAALQRVQQRALQATYLFAKMEIMEW